ncbi:MAG: SPOR domain-containing protein [Candidatus Krumholzibacteriota bacterium]
MTSSRKSGSRMRRSRRGRGLPRIMWVAIAVCIIGAVLIFRDQGSDVPTGIGEYQTVVTAPENETNMPKNTEPRSGDVDIADQTTNLTPEKPTGQTAAKPVVKEPIQQAAATNPTPKPAPVKPKATRPAPQLIQPVARGPYMVQTGSFGEVANADKEAARLKARGFDARVKVGNTSDDKLIFRVRIGYFKSRTQAEAFIRQNRKVMPGAIPAHR